MFTGLPSRVAAIGGFAPPVALWGAVVLAMLLAASCERRPVGHAGAGSGTVVARVDGEPLYREDFDAYLPEETPSGITSEESKTYFDRWLSTQLLYDAAKRSGLDMSRDLEWKLEQYRKDLVADRFVEDMLKQRAIVTPGEVLAYYQAHKNEYNLEFRVSHILTNTMEDAEAAREMLKTKPFSWVARKYSVDKHTGAGGDLGYLSKGNMLPEFEKVVFHMHVGEVSDIIESEFGYHIIQLTDIRPALNELPFESVAPEISRELLLKKRAAVYDSLLTALRKDANIEILDPDLRYAIELAESLKAGEKPGTARTPDEFTKAVPEPEGPRGAAADSAVEPEDTLGDSGE
jgi:peptidyl-prolyl cis-trans isomerase C